MRIELGQELSISQLAQLSDKGNIIGLSLDAVYQINKGHEFLLKKINESQNPIYGINTGFGSLYNKKIDSKDLSQLQENLLMSHACGTGHTMPDEVVRLMLALKVQSLSYGNSGVSLKLVESFIYLYNNDILPVIYSMGSLGASGDLSPLAHMSLPIIGKGKVKFNGTIVDAESLSIEPIKLGPKEGLALINGTQFMAAVLSVCLQKAHHIANWADTIGAISLEGFDGRIEPFHPTLHEIRPHFGQIKVSSNMRILLDGSEIIAQPKTHVQDPYSFRCIPQVHGATRNVIKDVEQVLLTEINSVTDNPNLLPEEDLIISGGNFHGQILAMYADFLSIAISELGSISERRTYQLISGLRGLPPFLVKNPGLNSGFMIPQYTSASMVNRNKVLCYPSSADSITSSNGQEDHVSMGATSVVKCMEINENTLQILAIEMMNASQALSFRAPLKTSNLLGSLIDSYREEIPLVENDIYMQPMLAKSLSYLIANSNPLLQV
jgi:histidine ammonia-lyase